MKKILFCLALLLPLSVNALVTYVWENLTTETGVSPPNHQVAFRGLMTFDDATIASDMLNATGPGNVPSDSPYFSYFGLEHIDFAGHELDAARKQRCTDVQDFPPDCNLLGEFVFGPWLGNFNFNLTFGAYLTGSLSTHDIGGDMTMHSTNGNVWAVDEFLSDDVEFKCVNSGCPGITGLWRRVPEPMTWTLLVLALAIAYSATAPKRILRRR